MFATKIAIIMTPNRIQRMEKIRAPTDFGDLSPYLMDKKSVNDLKRKIAEHKNKDSEQTTCTRPGLFPEPTADFVDYNT